MTDRYFMVLLRGELPFFFIVFFFCFLGFFKIKHYTIDAVPQSCGRRAIVKYMSQVPFTAAALYLSSGHAVRIIGSVTNTSLGYRLVK